VTPSKLSCTETVIGKRIRIPAVVCSTRTVDFFEACTHRYYAPAEVVLGGSMVLTTSIS
jgi:hypothetical protein